MEAGFTTAMASVVFLRGVNVGGHRTFRPSELAQQLRHFEVVNIGAAGTFIVRKPVSQATLRAELARRLPFETHIMIVNGGEILRLTTATPLAGEPLAADIIHFVSVLAKQRKPSQPLPLSIPSTGPWELRLVGQQGRFVYGVYRRQMKAISSLSLIDRIFGVPVTTRNWNTIMTIARHLQA